MSSSPEMAAYRELVKRLFSVRDKYDWEDSDEEDALLDDLDDVWRKLSDAERDIINKGPLKLLIEEGIATTPAQADQGGGEGR
jgi:hypothetical protein